VLEHIDLSHGAARTIDVPAEALRHRLRPDLARALVPEGAVTATIEFQFADSEQVFGRVAGHTGVAVRRDAIALMH
jgi:hypothetical protein